jgi:tetratricopeptide (TPR) repeat protein
MRLIHFACLSLLSPICTSGLHAQRHAIEYGLDDKVVQVAELPPPIRANAKQQLGADVAVCFYYKRAYLFGPGFDFWTWDGQYVLSDGRNAWTIDRESLARLVGQEEFDKFGKPLAYRCPVGLATVVGIILVLIICAIFFPSKRARAVKLARDERFDQALQVYDGVLKEIETPTADDKRIAYDTALKFLGEQGIPAQEAEANFRVLLGERDLDDSKTARAIGAAHEQAGEWAEAISSYQEAAALRREWDPADYDFLLKCIDRVRKKQG